jgi:cobalamin biosynthesis Co2+ chelatase CbiK
VGVVDGVPSLQDVVEQLKEKDIETVYLRSFAPDKVSKADEWSDALAKEGFKCIRAPVDIVEREAMAEILLDHLKMAFSLL